MPIIDYSIEVCIMVTENLIKYLFIYKGSLQFMFLKRMHRFESMFVINDPCLKKKKQHEWFHF